MPNGPALDGPGHKLKLHWRSSRHAPPPAHAGCGRGVYRHAGPAPEYAGVAAPALLLLAAGRVQRGRSGSPCGPPSSGGLRRRVGRGRPAGGGARGRLRPVDAAPGPGHRPGRRHHRRRAQARFISPRNAGRRPDRHRGRGAPRPLAAAEGHATVTLPGSTATRPRRTSGPRWCCGGCRTGSASIRPVPAARASSSSACASTCRATPAQHQLAGQHPARPAAGEHLAAERSQDVVLLPTPPPTWRARVIGARPGAARRGGRGPRLSGRQGPGGVITYQWGGRAGWCPGSAAGRCTGSSTRC